MHANERAEIVLAHEGVEESGIRVLMMHESAARFGALNSFEPGLDGLLCKGDREIGLLGGSTISSPASFLRQPGRRR